MMVRAAVSAKCGELGVPEIDFIEWYKRMDPDDVSAPTPWDVADYERALDVERGYHVNGSA